MTVRKRAKPLTAAARAQRDELILDLFLAGHTQQQIAEDSRVKLGQPRVNQIINAELDRATHDHILRNENAMTIYMARMERLVRAAFTHVDDGELKAIEVARRLMGDQAKVYELVDLPTSGGAGPIPPMGDTELDDEALTDELSQYRAQRSQVKNQQMEN